MVQIKIRNELSWHMISAGKAFIKSRENGNRKMWEAKAENREISFKPGELRYSQQET